MLPIFFVKIRFQSFELVLFPRIANRTGKFKKQCQSNIKHNNRQNSKLHRVAISLELTGNHTALLFHWNSLGKPHRIAISDKITQNHTALLFQMKLLKITPRCYFIRNYSKSHRAAISMKVHVRSKIQHVLKYNLVFVQLLYCNLIA